MTKQKVGGFTNQNVANYEFKNKCDNLGKKLCKTG